MPVAAAIPYIAAAGTVASTISTINTGRKATSAANDAQAASRELVANLKYQPIDIEKLKADTHAQAVTNATQSLALERSLQPDVAATREGVAKQISTDLARGGNLSPDTINQVSRAARVGGSLSGAPAGPITAATIGQTAEGLKQQRLGNAFSLLSANPLPVAGLDPGSLASQEVADNAAYNQFNAAKAGVNANLIQSGAKAQTSAAGMNAGITSGLTTAIPNILGQISNLPVFATNPSNGDWGGETLKPNKIT